LKKNKYNHIPLNPDFDNWWYQGRIKLVDYILSKQKYTKKINILEVGPGVGVNIEILQKYGAVDVLEVDDFFIGLIKDNKNLDVSNIYTNFAEINKPYDLIVFLDVLEHIQNYEIFLAEIKDLLSDKGICIMSVPAYESLLSQHDINLKHFRRYNWKTIRNQIDGKFSILNRYGYNFFLLPIRYIQTKILNNPTSDTTVSRYINNFLKKFISLEILFLKLKLNPKFGLSLFAVLKKSDYQN